jgi:hypothetical protein
MILTEASNGPRPFVHRVLRVVAILGLAAAVLGLSQDGMNLAQNGFQTSRFLRGGGVMTLYWLAGLFALSADVLLLIASNALLQWKSWARINLIVWAGLQITADLIRAIFYVSYYINYFATTSASTQATSGTSQQFVYSIVMAIASGFLKDIFPLLVLWLMLQSEIRDLWSAGRTGGFEVLRVEPIKPADY